MCTVDGGSFVAYGGITATNNYAVRSSGWGAERFKGAHRFRETQTYVTLVVKSTRHQGALHRAGRREHMRITIKHIYK